MTTTAVQPIGPPQAAIESNRFVRKVLHTSLDGIYVFDLNLHRNVFVNAQYTRITGYSLEALTVLDRQQFFEKFHPDDQIRVSRHMDEMVHAGEEVRQIEYRFMTHDGRWVHCLSRHAVFTTGPGGAATQVIGTLINITERKTAEQKLRESERRYKELVQHAGSAIIRWRSDGTITFFNDYAETFFGYPHQAAVGQHVGILVPRRASTGADLSGLVQKIVDHPDRYISNINENICRDGRRVWMAWTNRPIFDQNGKVTEILAVGIDATARMQAEAAVKQREAQFRQLADALPQLVWMAGADGQVDYYNRRREEYHGIERMRDGTFQWQPVLHPDDEAATLAAWQRALQEGETYHAEHRVKRVDGRYHWHLSRAIPVRDAAGRIVRWFGTATDIELVKQAQTELRSANDTLERLVAERTAVADTRARQLQALTVELIEAEERERQRIAQLLHDDLQQMLAAAKLQLEAADIDLAANSLIGSVDRILKTAIEKTRQLSHELNPPMLQHVSLDASLQWLVRQFKAQFGLRVHLHTHATPKIDSNPLVVFLFRALQELLFNVVKHAGVNDAHVHLSQADERLVLEVVDHGRGFNPDRLDAGSEKAAGLGLLSLRERASYMGGRLAIDSAVDQGCHFTLLVPTEPIHMAKGSTPAAEGDPAQPPTAPADRHRIGGLRVLFADDHTLMRKGLIKMVANNPAIEVVGEAADGNEAIAQVRCLRPDVVVMDVSMPNMNGIDATAAIRREFPEVRIIGLSMFEDDAIVQQMRDAGAQALVCKNAPAAQLLQAIYGPATEAPRPPDDPA